MSANEKASIVFCHGIWVDGSCFNKVIRTVQAEGHEVIAAQYGLDTPEGDVAAVNPAELARQLCAARCTETPAAVRRPAYQ